MFNDITPKHIVQPKISFLNSARNLSFKSNNKIPQEIEVSKDKSYKSGIEQHYGGFCKDLDNAFYNQALYDKEFLNSDNLKKTLGELRRQTVIKAPNNPQQ